MKIKEFIEKYGENIPEGSIVCDPTHKPELFFIAPSQEFVLDALGETGENAMYRDRTLERGFVAHGDTVYFPLGTVLELKQDRNYLPLWEIYETRNLGADGRPLATRFYRVEEIYPENYDGDAATIQFKKTYVDGLNG